VVVIDDSRSRFGILVFAETVSIVEHDFIILR
jgi:hypothetical protein